MAVVAQANALQLQVAVQRRAESPSPMLPSPGTVRRFREALIDWRMIRSYDDDILLMRTHETWGRYCLFCWLFEVRDPFHPPDFAGLPPDAPMRCPTAVGAKLLDVETGLWRLQHETRLRHQPELRKDPAFRKEHEAAIETPVMVYGRNARVCSDADLLTCSCEYAGMLAAVRWVADDRWAWDDPAIMDPAGRPADQAPC